MSYLSQSQADRIITAEELTQLVSIVEKQQLAIRCNEGQEYTKGDGYNLEGDDYSNNIEYATALYATVCFSQDTIQENIDDYSLLLLKNCALSRGDTYTYRQGGDSYTTLPKCHGLGSDVEVVNYWNMNDSAITLSRSVVEHILSL